MLPDAAGEIYGQGNILGTVSQSAGVPTGAIIERGSNANGEFVKYADGTMICHVRGLTLPRLSGLVYVMETVWIFPASFSTTDNLSTSMSFRNNGVSLSFPGWNENQVRQRMTGSYTNTSLATDQVFVGVNFNQNIPTGSAMTEVCATAIGRWF